MHIEYKRPSAPKIPPILKKINWHLVLLILSFPLKYQLMT